MTLTKTGRNPMRTRLRLFTKWGIELNKDYQVPLRSQREVEYASMDEMMLMLKNKNIDIFKQHIDFQSIKKGGVKVE